MGYKKDLDYAIRDSTYIIAAVVEFLFAWFGLLGVGWMYAGRMGFGMLLAVGYWGLLLIETIVATATMGLALCLFVPLNFALIFISALRARDYVIRTRAKGDVVILFGVVMLWSILLCTGCTLLYGLATSGAGAFLIELNKALENIPTPAPIEWP
jgi:hypothetical protein